jgi:hypothetical protein
MTPKKPMRGCGMADSDSGSARVPRAWPKCAVSMEEGKQLTRGVPVALRLEQAAPAGEDQVGALQQPALHVQHGRGRATECGQLVHAVINGDVGRQMAGEGQGHGRVEPGHQPAAGAFLQQVVQQRTLRRYGVDAAREHGNGAGDAAGLGGQVEARRVDIALDRFLEEDHLIVARGTRHQVLRALEDEIPAQMRQTQQHGPGITPA